MHVEIRSKVRETPAGFPNPLVVTRKALGTMFERVRHAVIQAAPNSIVHREKDLRPVDLAEFSVVPGIQTRRMWLDAKEHGEFLCRFYPDWREHFTDAFYKKLLEMHATWRLLEIKGEDTYLDLAGGCYTYAGRVHAKKQLLNDRHVNPVLRAELIARGVGLVQSSAENLPLPDRSIDKISCHHSFEHFRGDSDTLAILEIQRVLRPGGKACIVPLFVGRGYFEIVDLPWTPRSDLNAQRVFDPTSPFPGGRWSGGFARVYDLGALCTRILRSIDLQVFSVSVIQLEGNGDSLPDPTLPCHRTDPAIDFPYRAILIERHR